MATKKKKPAKKSAKKTAKKTAKKKAKPAPKKAAKKKAKPAPKRAKPAPKKKPAPAKKKAAARVVVPEREEREIVAEQPAVKAPPDPAVELAQAVAALALDKKAEDVVILKVTDLTSYADCFILASAPSERQVQAIARHVDDEMRRAGKPPVGTEGLEQGHWVLVDLGAAVLHVFLSSARQYYDLEGFWTDAPHIDVDETHGLEVLAQMKAARQARDEAAHAAAANE